MTRDSVAVASLGAADCDHAATMGCFSAAMSNMLGPFCGRGTFTCPAAHCRWVSNPARSDAFSGPLGSPSMRWDGAGVVCL